MWWLAQALGVRQKLAPPAAPLPSFCVWLRRALAFPQAFLEIPSQ